LSRPLTWRCGRRLQNRRGKPCGDVLSVEHVLGYPWSGWPDRK
jgi:hypothetical protein